MSTARSIGTANITFGLVSVPVKIYTSESSEEKVHFNMLHDADNARLKQQYVCTQCNEVVDREHTVKGYEHAKGQYVVCTAAELEAIDAVATHAIELVECVAIVAVDPVYVEKTYYLGPDKGGERGYQLLFDAMEATGYVAIGRWSARGKEHIVMLRTFEDGLAIHQLRYQHEVKPWSDVPVRVAVDVKPAELGLAQKLLAAIESDTFDVSKYSDRVHEGVKKLLEVKIGGGEFVTPPAAEPPTTIDLMEALKKSIAKHTDPNADPYRLNRAAERKAAKTEKKAASKRVVRASKKRKRAA